MPGAVVGTQLNYGFAGKVSRNALNKIDSKAVKSILNGSGVETMSSIPFGAAVVLNTDNTVSLFGQSGSGVTAATAAAFAGIAVAEVKQGMTLAYGANSTAGQYDPTNACDRLVMGTTVVNCVNGTPTAGGAVYLCTVAGTGVAVGDFLTTSNAGSCTAVLLPNCQWTTGKQSTVAIQGAALTMAELTILYPVSA
jgi:hypothetical protein